MRRGNSFIFATDKHGRTRIKRKRNAYESGGMNDWSSVIFFLKRKE
jgi:hypothetical protein